MKHEWNIRNITDAKAVELFRDKFNAMTPKQKIDVIQYFSRDWSKEAHAALLEIYLGIDFEKIPESGNPWKTAIPDADLARADAIAEGPLRLELERYLSRKMGA